MEGKGNCIKVGWWGTGGTLVCNFTPWSCQTPDRWCVSVFIFSQNKSCFLNAALAMISQTKKAGTHLWGGASAHLWHRLQTGPGLCAIRAWLASWDSLLQPEWWGSACGGGVRPVDSFFVFLLLKDFCFCYFSTSLVVLTTHIVVGNRFSPGKCALV